MPSDGERHEMECRVIWHLCSALAEMCAATPGGIVTRLAGYLWDEEERLLIMSNDEADDVK